jgi:hypothetical protein
LKIREIFFGGKPAAGHLGPQGAVDNLPLCFPGRKLFNVLRRRAAPARGLFLAVSKLAGAPWASEVPIHERQ